MIEINNLTTAVVDEDFLKKTAKIVIDGEKKKAIELSIALVGQERIKKLNKKYRGKNRATDVLSFSYRASTFGSEDEDETLASSTDGSGDIVICLGEVKKNAKRFGTTFKKELARVLIHGVLHLLGYDHEKNEIAAKEVEETKASSSATERAKRSEGGKENEVFFDSSAARVGDEDKSSSSPFAAARVGDEDKSSSSPFAAARVMEEKQNYYLKICLGVTS